MHSKRISVCTRIEVAWVRPMKYACRIGTWAIAVNHSLQTGHSRMETMVYAHNSTIQHLPINSWPFRRKTPVIKLWHLVMPLHFHRICVWAISKHLIHNGKPKKRHFTLSQPKTIHLMGICVDCCHALITFSYSRIKIIWYFGKNRGKYRSLQWFIFNHEFLSILSNSSSIECECTLSEWTLSCYLYLWQPQCMNRKKYATQIKRFTDKIYISL